MSKQATFTELDIRVRARNLKSGVLTDKDVEKHLSGLADVEANADNFAVPQPVFATEDMEDGDDDLDDDMDDEDDVEETPAANTAPEPSPEAS